ncbi:conserved membrane hypothetical protein [Tenacibaculum sp. 190524A02b]|uniref:Permease n=1 Tax=Tenacibaculum vairaonense TaxID=3137860 RepID=A0ABM9PJ43_9FLAO
MKAQISSILILFFIGYFIISFVSYFIYKNKKNFIFDIIVGLLFLVILYITTGFPFKSITAFGGFDPFFLTGLLLVFVIIGMVFNYLFYRKENEKIKWILFFKPFFISPIILLPLIGAIKFDSVENVQLISLCFLAFQNGFFWREVFNKALKSNQ